MIIFESSTKEDGNMSPRTGDWKEALQNRKKFLEKFGINEKLSIQMNQIHSKRIVYVTKKDAKINSINDLTECDGLITDDLDICLIVKSADCHQIGFYDPVNNTIGLIHAGWKGLDLGIIPEVISQMQERFHTSPKDLVVKFGPSIGPCCYKNLPDLTQKNDPKWKPYINKEDKTFGLDIWGFAEDQLKKQGVPAENIHNPKICTYHTDKYFSHRKSVAENLSDDFRFATILKIAP